MAGIQSQYRFTLQVRHGDSEYVTARAQQLPNGCRDFFFPVWSNQWNSGMLLNSKPLTCLSLLFPPSQNSNGFFIPFCLSQVIIAFASFRIPLPHYKIQFPKVRPVSKAMALLWSLINFLNILLELEGQRSACVCQNTEMCKVVYTSRNSFYWNMEGLGIVYIRTKVLAYKNAEEDM